MPISDATPPEGAALDIQVDDIVQVLARRNPGAARSALERAGRIVTLVSKAVLNDADAIGRFAGLNDAGALNVVHQIASGLGERPDDDVRPILPVPTEWVQGTGLGEIVGREAGMARLATLLSEARLEDWAGPTLDADELSTSEGVTPEMLDGWKRSRAVVALSDRDGRTVYPSKQFSDRRPIPGLAEMQAIVGDARTAWLWLVEPDDDGISSWLDVLRRGDAAEVLDAARQDFR